MENITNPTQKKASYFIIAVVMWEFFSYFGMQAMLILYLTQYLHLSDANAYKIYGNFTSLIFVTPIIGGWLADKFCGYRYAVMCGCVLIIAGHLILGSFTLHGLYVGLSLLILGIGLFKSNAICLISTCFPAGSAAKNSAMTWYYVSGNVGAIGSQILCPYVAQTINWSAGFALAAIGMMLGLVTLILSKPYFTWYDENINDTLWKKLPGYIKIVVSVLIISIALASIYLVMVYEVVSYLLVVISLLSVVIFYQIYKEASLEKRKSLLTMVMLTLFAIIFWIFDQQDSSSISLFVSRFIDRNVGGFVIPAGMFQSINPAVILVVGVTMSYVWRMLDKKNIKTSASTKLSIAILLLTFGFVVLTHACNIAAAQQSAPLYLPVLSFALLGASELFVDPVLLAAISSASPANAQGRLVAIYYLAVGAIANYLAAWVAKFTTDPTTNTATVFTYRDAYLEVVYVSIFMFIALVLLKRYRKRTA